MSTVNSNSASSTCCLRYHGETATASSRTWTRSRHQNALPSWAGSVAKIPSLSLRSVSCFTAWATASGCTGRTFLAAQTSYYLSTRKLYLSRAASGTAMRIANLHRNQSQIRATGLGKSAKIANVMYEICVPYERLGGMSLSFGNATYEKMKGLMKPCRSL